MADVLDKINAYKREEIAAAKANTPLDELEQQIQAVTPVRGFASAVSQKLSSGQTALIAEIKKASPSKGLIREDFDPPSLARAYEAGGACCLSVLTDKPSFQGAPEYLGTAREATALPVLRKDFMLDPYQVFEARAWGADCVLVIMASVSDEQAAELISAARSLNMDTLVEVHSDEELDRAVELDSNLVGINNRDLTTFETNLETTERLAPRIPNEKIVVSESGIFTNDDIRRLSGAGVRCFLVGESLMRQENVEHAVRSLLEPAITAHRETAQ
jgi:indole-3-glycerol phosphate synthase